MTTILVIDDEAIIREPIAASLRTAGYETFTACNGKEGFAKIATSTPHMILLDVTMPLMDGLGFLTQLRANPQTRTIPVILLTSNSDKESIIQAAKLGVQDYLLKTRFSLPELLARIQKNLHAVEKPPVVPAPEAKPSPQMKPPPAPFAPPLPTPPTSPAGTNPPPAAEWPRLLSREQTLEKLDTIASGKTIAGVVAQVIAMAASPNADLNDIVRILNTDPILASRVLQLANSPAFASKKTRITSVEEATRNIGVRGIQNMAMAVGIFGAFPPDGTDGFNSMRCWQHCFAVADLMALFVREHEPLHEGMNHLVGLCHDLGEILLRQHFTPLYTEILDYAEKNNLPPNAVEATALGIRRPELVSRILSRIGLPVPVVQAIREFYERQVKDQAAGMSQLARALLIANQIAHGMLMAASLQETIAPIIRADWRLLGGEKAPPNIDPALRRNEIIATTTLLARLPVKDEERLLTPLIPKRSLKIIYLRPSIYVELDPVAYALALTTDLSIASALPTVDEIAAADGLVVAALRAETGFLARTDLADLCKAAGRPHLPILALLSQSAPLVDLDKTTYTYPITLADLNRWLLSTVAHQRKSSPVSAAS